MLRDGTEFAFDNARQTPRKEAESSSKRSDALGRERQMAPIV